MSATATAATPAVRGLVVTADGVDVAGRGGRRLLEDVSIAIGAGELVAVVGASGAGKSTLLDALAGVRSVAGGTVRYDGVDISDRGERTTVGYVPQDDIVHRDLDVRTTLRATARLRIAGVDVATVDALVDDALRATWLTDRAGVRVGDLSGGQRKRASIAAELLTRPRALFLDEPTSGLDTSTADEIMRTLRSLADDGTTVVLTTHRREDLASCDRVVTVADHRVVMNGGPSEPSAPGPVGASPASNPVRAVTQWSVLVRRNIALLLANRLTLAITFGSPVAVIAMFLVLFEPGAFDAAGPDPTSAVMIVYWAAFAAFFFGLTSGLLQVCTELPIVRRERLAGLGVAPYLLAKLAVLVPMLAATVVAMVVVLRVLDRFPVLDAGATTGVIVVLLLDALAAAAIGLLTSAAVRDPSHATLALPMVCFPAVLFSGGVLPVASMATAGRLISVAMPDRWAFEATGRLVDVADLAPRDAQPLAAHGNAFTGGIVGHSLVMTVITLVALAAAAWILQHRTPRTPR